MIAQPALARLLGLFLAAVFGLILALAVVAGGSPVGFASHGVLATGTTAGGPSPPPHPNV
jgi:hypothetical protein